MQQHNIRSQKHGKRVPILQNNKSITQVGKYFFKGHNINITNALKTGHKCAENNFSIVGSKILINSLTKITKANTLTILTTWHIDAL